MKATYSNILFFLGLLIETLSKSMLTEKNMEKGNKQNKALKHLQEAQNILDD